MRKYFYYVSGEPPVTQDGAYKHGDPLDLIGQTRELARQFKKDGGWEKDKIWKFDRATRKLLGPVT